MTQQTTNRQKVETDEEIVKVWLIPQINQLCIIKKGKRSTSSLGFLKTSDSKFEYYVIELRDFSGEQITFPVTFPYDEGLFGISSSSKYMVFASKIYGFSSTYQIKIWETGNQEWNRQFSQKDLDPVKVSLTSDGQLVILMSVSGEIGVYESNSGIRRMYLQGHNGYITKALISADDKLLITSGNDHFIKVWNLPDLKLVTCFSGESGIANVAISKDKTTIIAVELSGQKHFLRLVNFRE